MTGSQVSNDLNDHTAGKGGGENGGVFPPGTTTGASGGSGFRATANGRYRAAKKYIAYAGKNMITGTDTSDTK